MLRPTMGTIVVVKGFDWNQKDEHPAVVTSVWGNAEIHPEVWTVNLTVFPDGGNPQPVGGVHVFPTKQFAMEWQSREAHRPCVGYWPEHT